MTDRNDGRPRHSASHIHCAVPFFCARSGTEGEAARRCGGGSRLSAGNASRSLRACVGAVWGSGSAREGRVAVRGRAKGFGGEWVVRSARNAWRSLRVCVGAAWGSGSVREGSEKVLGREQVFGEEWVVRSAGLTHFRRSSSRVRVLLYIRPPRHRREIKAMGTKDAPCEHPSPAKPSAPAPSAFTLPPRRSHFPRIPFGDAHEDFGLPQQQLSTMGYPRKSYPHRCSPPCAKRARPRACARVYIIYRSPVGRSRGVSAPPCAGWGRAKAKADASSCSAEHAACVPNHCVQRRKCTRPTPPLPVRSPRGSLSTAAPLPADGRSAERKGGSAQGQPRPCPCTLPAATCLRPCPRPLMGVAPCVLPAATCLRPRPRRLNGHPASAGGRENDRMAHRRTTTPTHRTQRGNDTCTIRVPRRKGAQSVVHNL